MGKRDLSPRHGEFLTGMELAVAERPFLLLLANVLVASCGRREAGSVSVSPW